MHISKVSIVNYRNFSSAKLIFQKGINTIIGENGSGKTNLFRAIRLLLDDNMSRSATRLEESDFHRGLGDWRGHWIIISLEFEEISADESIQSLFLHGTGNIAQQVVANATYNLIFRPNNQTRVRLSKLDDGDATGLAAIRQTITIADYEPVFTGRSTADFNNADVYKEIVGDFDLVKFSETVDFPATGAKVPAIFSMSQEICFTFIQALRDVVSEFQNNRTNPLLSLLKSKSGNITPAVFAPIADMVRNLNTSIEQLPDVQTLTSDITGTIKDAAGETYSPSSLSIKSDLSDEADRLFQSLKLFVGESNDGHEGAIYELSLGGANLIYLTLKLLEFKYQKAKQSFANFLIIEEPEAHIHTHIQKTLFDKLNYEDTQIIYSTHSTHISEVSNVRNINILGKTDSRCEAYQPATGLTLPEVGNIQRYLDAVRSNLLFAKSVILVEGDAEELLVPILIKKVLGISLDELGISLINIRSTGFQNVAILFSDARIRKKCAIITDLDATIIDTTPNATDTEPMAKMKRHCLESQQAGIVRKGILETFVAGNPWLKLSLAPNTFEVNFIGAGNASKVVAVLGEVYKAPATIALAKTELESPDMHVFGPRVLTMASQEGKGWFAIMLGKMIDHETIIPDYILDAVFFCHSNITAEIWFNIIGYRVRCIESCGTYLPEVIAEFRTKLDRFRSGTLNFTAIRNEMLTTFPADKINSILNRF